MILAEKLNFLMLKHGVSTPQLSKATGIDATTINRILNSYTKSPKTDTVFTLAKFFGIEVNKLLDDNESLLELKIENVKQPSLKNILAMLMKRNGNLSIGALHKYTNVSKSTISDILNDKMLKPSIETLTKLSVYFNVTVPQLCGLEKIPLYKNAHVQPVNKTVPLIHFNDIGNFTNKIAIKPIKYIISSLGSLQDDAFATIIVDENFSPDFFKNQILVINTTKPSNKDFAIYNINNVINIYELILEINQSTILRKAGNLEILNYKTEQIKLLGKVVQKILS